MGLKTRVFAYTLAAALISSTAALAQTEGRGAALVDLGRRVRRRQGVRRPVHEGRRHLGRHRHRRRRERAHGGHQPHRRRQPADDDAVQHRQAVRRAGQRTASCATSTSGRRPASGARCCRKAIVDAAVRDGKFYAVPVNIHGQNWLFYNTKVFADAGVEPPEDVSRAHRGRREAEGQGHHPARPRRPAELAGATLFHAVLVGHGGPDLFRKVYGRRDQDAVKSAGFKKTAEVFGQAARPRRSGQPGPQLERRHAPRDHRQGGDAVHGRLGQGRVHRRRPDRRQGIWLHRRRRGRRQARHGRRRVRVPGDQGQGAARGAGQAREVMLDPTTQIAFNKKKGSVPVRLDVDVSSHGRLRAEGACGAGGSGKPGPSDGTPGDARTSPARCRTRSRSTGTPRA